MSLRRTATIALLVALMAAPCWGLVGSGIFNCGGYPRGADYGRDDPNVAGKELLFEWREIEPEEGVYNWKLIDDCIQPWADAGKMVAIRVMSACNEGSASPAWVFEKCGVPKVDSSGFSKSNIIYPVFWNKTFERKYSDMVKALAGRYDGNPNIEFVQVGGVGRWEETYVHTENDAMSRCWQELGYNHSRYIAHCRRMADVFRHCFRKTPVLISISIGGPDPIDHDRKRIGYELADYAVKHGLYLKQNGWGAYYSYTDHEHFSRIFAQTQGRTKRAYEQGVAATNPWGWERGTFRSNINRALLDCPDYLWIYEEDLCRPEFAADVAFAVKHLSAKSYRDMGPLYIRFGRFNVHYENPTYDAVLEDEFNGLVNRWVMQPWPDGSKLEPVEIDGVACKRTSPEFPYVYLDLEDTVVVQESGGTGKITRGAMDITYWDEGTSQISVEYNWNGSGFDSKATFSRTNEKRWKRVRLILTEMRFDTHLSVPEKDFRISAADGNLALERIELRLYNGSGAAESRTRTDTPDGSGFAIPNHHNTQLATDNFPTSL